MDQGKYKEALTQFEKYLDRVPGDPIALSGRASCIIETSVDLGQNEWVINNLREINSPFDDFAAAYGDGKSNTIIFSSKREGATGRKSDKTIGGNFSDLFMASRPEGKGYSAPSLLDISGLINTKSDEGVAVMAFQYDKIYFTRCAKLKKGTDYCLIMEAVRSGSNWQKPVIIFKDNRGNAGHPAISSNGLTMIFSSDMPGGKGGKDLWKTTRPSLSKPFGTAENFGSVINTPGDEMFPSLVSDTILYFASNGMIGFGGLDIYCVTLGKKGVTTAEHLPRPLNSPSDDFGIHFEADNTQGLITSRRAGGLGGDDIYSFVKIRHRISIVGSVSDELSLKALCLLPVNATGTKKDTLASVTDTLGCFVFGNDQLTDENSYNFTFSKENYFTKKKLVNIGKIKSDTVYHLDILLQPIPDKPIVLPDIYYELDKWDLLPQYQDSLLTLVSILNDNPDIVIELASHTDSRASSEYNDTLSLKRAESVVTFLTEKGISKSRLSAKGFGERMPRILATDIIKDGLKFESGTRLTEAYILSITDEKRRDAAHQLNRRTEFSVIRKSLK